MGWGLDADSAESGICGWVWGGVGIEFGGVEEGDE